MALHGIGPTHDPKARNPLITIRNIMRQTLSMIGRQPLARPFGGLLPICLTGQKLIQLRENVLPGGLTGDGDYGFHDLTILGRGRSNDHFPPQTDDHPVRFGDQRTTIASVGVSLSFQVGNAPIPTMPGGRDLKVRIRARSPWQTSTLSGQYYRRSKRGSFSQASKARGTDASDENLMNKYLSAATAQSLTKEAYRWAGYPLLPVVCRIASAHSLFVSQAINHTRPPTMSSAPAVKPEISFADRTVISATYQMSVRQQPFASVRQPP